MGPFNSGAAVGANGAAISSQDSPVVLAGLVEAIYVKYNDAPPGTTKVTIKTKGANGAAPALTLFSLDNANTDGWFFPRAGIHSTAGATIADLYDKVPIFDILNVEINEANGGDHVDVWFLVS
jgi:hypothetical protein